VYPTRFARLQDSVLKKILGSADDKDETSGIPEEFKGTFISEGAHGHDHGLADQFESFGRKYSDSFSRPCLVSFFETLRSGGYGKVVRAKGIFQTPEDWIKVELASGEVHVEASPIAEYSALSVIGQEIRPQAMDAALDECRKE
jgi:G3E family GTPase